MSLRTLFSLDKTFNFENNSNLLRSSDNTTSLTSLGGFPSNGEYYDNLKPELVQASTSEFNSGSNSLKMDTVCGIWEFTSVGGTIIYRSNNYSPGFTKYNYYYRYSDKAWAYEELDIAFDIKIDYHSSYDGAIGFFTLGDSYLTLTSAIPTLVHYPNKAILKSLELVYTKNSSDFRIFMLCNFFLNYSGTAKSINTRFDLCGASAVNLGSKANINIKKNLDDTLQILINSSEVIKFTDIYTGPITSDTNLANTISPSVNNNIKNTQSSNDNDLIKPFLPTTAYKNLVSNFTKTTPSSETKLWDKSGSGNSTVFTATDGTVTLNGKSQYTTYFTNLKNKYYPNVYIDNLKMKQTLYGEELPVDILNPVSVTVEPLQTDFSEDLMNPVSISVKEDVEKDLFPVTIDAAKDLNTDLNTSIDVKKDVYYEKLPISLEVQWEELNQDLFNIDFTVNAPVYQLELGPEFKSGWDDRKYLIFRNGALLPKQTYNIIIPSPFNNYLKKMIYSTVPFWKEDRIEVFYIENQQNFANVPFNREVRVASYIYYAKLENQKLIKIPYPNSSYRRSADAFLLFNDLGEHLDYRYDYTVSADGRYVTLTDANALEEVMVNYVVFTFCYVGNRSINGQEEETDPNDTVNLSEIKYSYSYSNDNPTDTSGLVTFSPTFAGWPNMTKENYMLFGNTVFIDQSRYNVVSNNQIQFIDPNEKLIANQRRYVMCIPVKDTKPQKLASNQTRYEIVLIPNNGSTDQSIFTLQPPSSGNWYPYLIFRGSRLMDVKNEYTYDETTNVLKITDSSCYLQPGRNLTVVYFNKSYTDLKKENIYIKMQFKASSTGTTEIPKSLYHNTNIQFDYTNLIVFLNGVYLEPDRYTIEPGNWIKLNPNISIAGYGPQPYETKMFTAVYLMEYVDPDANAEAFNDEYGQKEVDPSEDNDETRFEEVYAYVKKKPV